MKMVVLGQRLSGKTPFSIALADALECQHLETLNWLRSDFNSSEFAHMLLDPDWMEHIVESELAHNPDACAKYLRHHLTPGSAAVIDGLFSLKDFIEFFDPVNDHVVRLTHMGSSLTPTRYESGLAEIDEYINRLINEGKVDRGRVHNYTYNHHRRGAQPDFARAEGQTTCCSSLAVAIEHFIAQMKTPAAAA